MYRGVPLFLHRGYNSNNSHDIFVLHKAYFKRSFPKVQQGNIYVVMFVNIFQQQYLKFAVTDNLGDNRSYYWGVF